MAFQIIRGESPVEEVSSFISGDFLVEGGSVLQVTNQGDSLGKFVRRYLVNDHKSGEQAYSTAEYLLDPGKAELLPHLGNYFHLIFLEEVDGIALLQGASDRSLSKAEAIQSIRQVPMVKFFPELPQKEEAEEEFHGRRWKVAEVVHLNTSEM